MIAGELQNTGHVYMRTWEMGVVFTHTLGGRREHGGFTGGNKKKKKRRVTHIKKNKKNWDMNKWQEDRDEGSRCSGEVHETWFEGKCRK